MQKWYNGNKIALKLKQKVRNSARIVQNLAGGIVQKSFGKILV